MYIWAMDRVSGCNFPAARGERRGESKVRSHTHTAHSGFPIPGSPPHHTAISLSYNYYTSIFLYKLFLIFLISVTTIRYREIEWTWIRIRADPNRIRIRADPDSSSLYFTVTDTVPIWQIKKSGPGSDPDTVPIWQVKKSGPGSDPHGSELHLDPRGSGS